MPHASWGAGGTFRLNSAPVWHVVLVFRPLGEGRLLYGRLVLLTSATYILMASTPFSCSLLHRSGFTSAGAREFAAAEAALHASTSTFPNLWATTFPIFWAISVANGTRQLSWRLPPPRFIWRMAILSATFAPVSLLALCGGFGQAIYLDSNKSWLFLHFSPWPRHQTFAASLRC